MNYTHFIITLSPQICSTTALVGFEIVIRADLDGIINEHSQIEFQKCLSVSFNFNFNSKIIYGVRSFKGASLCARPLNKNCTFYKDFALDSFIKNLKTMPLFADISSRSVLMVIFDDKAHFLRVLKTLPFFFPSKLRDKFFLNGMMKEWEKTIMYYPKWFHQYEQDISHSPNTNL